MAESDSVRYVQRDKETPYALIWKRRTLNLWLAGRNLGTCVAPPRFARYSAVYTGTVPDLFAVNDTIYLALADTAASNCTVQAGAGYVVASGDTLLRGLVWTERADACGVRRDTLALELARAGTL